MGKKKFPGKIWIDREMIQSKAFLALRGFAPQLLMLVFGKRQFEKQGRKGKEKWVCINGDSINITYTEFKNTYGISKPKLTRAKDDLLAKGFLSIIRQGGTFRQDKGVYKLSDNWCIWRPGMIFETRERDTTKRVGFCKKKIKVGNESVPIHSNESVPISQVLGERKRTHKKGGKIYYLN